MSSSLESLSEGLSLLPKGLLDSSPEAAPTTTYPAAESSGGLSLLPRGLLDSSPETAPPATYLAADKINQIAIAFLSGFEETLTLLHPYMPDSAYNNVLYTTKRLFQKHLENIKTAQQNNIQSSFSVFLKKQKEPVYFYKIICETTNRFFCQSSQKRRNFYSLWNQSFPRSVSYQKPKPVWRKKATGVQNSVPTSPCSTIHHREGESVVG